MDFKRAASEKAQYVHNSRHPDEPPPVINPRPPSLRDYSRHPSLTMRQLERHFLSPNESDSKQFRVCEILKQIIFLLSLTFFFLK